MLNHGLGISRRRKRHRDLADIYPLIIPDALLGFQYFSPWGAIATDEEVQVRVTGGEYQVKGYSWSTGSRVVPPQVLVRTRLRSPLEAGASTVLTLSVGESQYKFTVVTK